MTATALPKDLTSPPIDDHVGGIETAGVEYLPEEARDSRPRNVGAVFLGANLTWTNVVFGAFAILFGLSFWQTVTSMVVGTAIGTLAVLPTATIGPRTGTNMTVSSGAFFGIRGRFIGSGLALAIALAFAAVTVWTSGDALVAAGHRLLGSPDTHLAHGIAYAVVAALMVAVALYGHATIVAMQKIVVPVVGTLVVVGFFAFAGSVDTSAAGGNYNPRRLLADLGTVGRPLRRRPDLLRPDDRRLHPPALANPVQRQADLRRTRCRHVHRRDAAQPLRRLHRAFLRQPDRLVPR